MNFDEQELASKNSRKDLIREFYFGTDSLRTNRRRICPSTFKARVLTKKKTVTLHARKIQDFVKVTPLSSDIQQTGTKG
jgi:hypothetical protein